MLDLSKSTRWTPRRARPLHLRVWLESPIAWDGRDPITIEGALQHEVVLRATGRDPADVFAGYRGPRVEIPIPIVDVEIGGRPIACASIGFPPTGTWPRPGSVPSLRYRRRRADVDAYGATRITTSAGWAKSLNIPVPTLATPWLDFYVRGDRDLLEDLLRGVGGLGRDNARGLGVVLGTEILPDPEDRSLLYRNVPQRVLPRMESGPYAASALAPGTWTPRDAATRAPYWMPDTRTTCVCPLLGVR
jgi:hypothetical protein